MARKSTLRSLARTHIKIIDMLVWSGFWLHPCHDFLHNFYFLFLVYEPTLPKGWFCFLKNRVLLWWRYYICRLELWLQPLKFAMMVFFPMTIAMLCYCKVYVILWSRQKEFLKLNLLAISVAARAEARARPLGNKRRSKSLFTNGSRYRLGRSPGAREHTSLRRRRSSVISPLVLMKNKQRKEMRRLRSLARRIVWMVVMELFAHYPIALFYLLRSDDNPRPMTNLLVLVMHFSVAFFNSVSTTRLVGLFLGSIKSERVAIH